MVSITVLLHVDNMPASVDNRLQDTLLAHSSLVKHIFVGSCIAKPAL